MAPHEHEEYRQQMGHVWLGFAEDQMTRLLEQGGIHPCPRVLALPPDEAAKGPSLFTASAHKVPRPCPDAAAFPSPS